jgi:hypothetical protein
MQKGFHLQTRPAPSGGLVRVQARTADLTSWLGPTWATLCGIVASGGFSWEGHDWLRLALLILLVDGGWGTLWAALAGSNWTTPLRRWRALRQGDGQRDSSFLKLPYTLPGAPGHRAGHLMGRLVTWWREALWPTCGSAILSVVAALPVTALVGALLGPELMLLSVAALALMQLGVVWESGQGVVPPGWDAFIGVALPWLAGHLTFEPVTLPSAGLGVLFALAWGKSWQVSSRRGWMIAAGGQLLATAYLVVAHRPLAAAILFLVLVPQLALLPWTRAGHPAFWYVRHTRPWLMTAMAVAALAVAF